MKEMLDDDALLSTLGAALAPEPSSPTAGQMAALHAALDARSGLISAAAPDAVIVPLGPSAGAAGSRSARIHRLRHPVAVLVGVAVLATSGVAAAGVAMDTMPGPARHVAYSIGLPVTSPALESARATLGALEATLQGHDRAAVLDLTALLRTQLAALSDSDRAQIEPAAGRLLALANAFLEGNMASGAPQNPIPPVTGAGTHADTGNADNAGDAGTSGSSRPSEGTDSPATGSPESGEGSGGASVPPMDHGSQTPQGEVTGDSGTPEVAPTDPQGGSGDPTSVSPADSGSSDTTDSPLAPHELGPAFHSA